MTTIRACFLSLYNALAELETANENSYVSVSPTYERRRQLMIDGRMIPPYILRERCEGQKRHTAMKNEPREIPQDFATAVIMNVSKMEQRNVRYRRASVRWMIRTGETVLVIDVYDQNGYWPILDDGSLDLSLERALLSSAELTVRAGIGIQGPTFQIPASLLHKS